MEQLSLLEMIKNRLRALLLIAQEHKAPKPVVDAIDDLKEHVSKALIRIAGRISGRVNSPDDIQSIMNHCLIKDADGNLLNPFHLKSEDFRPELFATSLSREKRFWNQTSLSVAEHCINLAKAAKALYPGREDLVQWALFHEIFESYTGDLATPFKKCLPEYKIAENKALEYFASTVGLCTEMPHEVHLLDRRMMIAEALVYMNKDGEQTQFWKELGVQSGDKEFGFPVLAIENEVVALRPEPMGENEAKVAFATAWIEAKLPLSQALVDMVIPPTNIYLAESSAYSAVSDGNMAEEKEYLVRESGAKVIASFDNPYLASSDAATARAENLKMMQKSSHIVIANCMSKAEEPDAGVVYTLSVAHALGKKVIIYNSSLETRGRQRRWDALGYLNDKPQQSVNPMLFDPAKTDFAGSIKDAALLIKTEEEGKRASLVSKNPEVLRYIKKEEQTPSLCVIAVAQDKAALEYIADRAMAESLKILYEDAPRSEQKEEGELLYLRPKR